VGHRVRRIVGLIRTANRAFVVCPLLRVGLSAFLLIVRRVLRITRHVPTTHTLTKMTTLSAISLAAID